MCLHPHTPTVRVARTITWLWLTHIIYFRIFFLVNYLILYHSYVYTCTLLPFICIYTIYSLYIYIYYIRYLVLIFPSRVQSILLQLLTIFIAVHQILFGIKTLYRHFIRISDFKDISRTWVKCDNRQKKKRSQEIRSTIVFFIFFYFEHKKLNLQSKTSPGVRCWLSAVLSKRVCLVVI